MEKITSIIVILLVSAIIYSVGPAIIRWLMAHLFVTAYQRTLHKKDLEKRQRTLGGLFSNIFRILTVVTACYLLLRVFISTIDLAPLFASAGVIGVAIGFGAQSLIKDFLSGVFIISENQYRVGDVIEIDGFSGTVESIGFRSTVLRDVDGAVHYFPNGLVQHVMNKTMGYSMARFTVAVAPDTDIEKVTALINQLGKDIATDPSWEDKIIEAPQFVMMGEFTATSVALIVSGKTQPSDQWSVVAEMRQRILEAFEKAGIVIGTVPMVHASTASKKRK
ncbi:MAG: mechanosensitive ion channel family protein [Candidatus Saccharimonas sp.]